MYEIFVNLTCLNWILVYPEHKSWLCFTVASWNKPIIYKCSQTCIKRSPLELRNSDLIRQVTSIKRLISYEIFYDRTRKRWPFLFKLNTCLSWTQKLALSRLYCTSCQSRFKDKLNWYCFFFVFIGYYLNNLVIHKLR
jgi:hypothetical protein